jgi:hypothetical protein
MTNILLAKVETAVEESSPWSIAVEWHESSSVAGQGEGISCLCNTPEYSYVLFG